MVEPAQSNRSKSNCNQDARNVTQPDQIRLLHLPIISIYSNQHFLPFSK